MRSDMKIKFTGNDATNPDIANYREGDSTLDSGDTFEVPEDLGKALVSSHSQFVAVTGGKKDEDG